MVQIVELDSRLPAFAGTSFAGMTMSAAPAVNVVIPAEAGIHRPGPCYYLNRSKEIPSL